MAAAELRFADLAGGRMRYSDAGAGRCVLLIHGSYGSSSHWADNTRSLCARARIVAPDLPGFGDSAGAPVSADLEYFARSLKELMGRLGEARYSVAGYSFGALVAAQLARVDAISVRSLTLISPPVRETPPAVKAIHEEIGNLASRGSTRASVQLMLEKIALHNPHRRTSEAFSLTVDNLRRCRFRARPIQRASSLPELLRGVSCPAMALMGGRDPFYDGDPEGAAERLKKAVPGLRTRIVPGAAHWLCYDSPEATNEAILAAMP